MKKDLPSALGVHIDKMDGISCAIVQLFPLRAEQFRFALIAMLLLSPNRCYALDISSLC